MYFFDIIGCHRVQKLEKNNRYYDFWVLSVHFYITKAGNDDIDMTIVFKFMEAFGRLQILSSSCASLIL